MERLPVLTTLEYNGNGNGYEKDLPIPAIGQFDVQIAATPTLQDLGLAIHSPSERKDGGAVQYTTLAETIRQWSEDPYGNRTLDFVKTVYGIKDEDFDRIMDEAGMSEYLQYKREGRFIGMVASQILKPTYYFLSNALMLGYLARQGIPTAFMVGEYASDTFYTGNGDKGQSFGRIEFPVGIETTEDDSGVEHQTVKSVSIELKPYGIKNDDGSITRIKTIDQANGYKCEQVLVSIVGAKGPKNQDYSHVIAEKGFSRSKAAKTVHTYYEAALGMYIPGLINDHKLVGKEEVIDSDNPETTISIADFYRILWLQTIERLREAGELPSVEEMPMFFVDAKDMYGNIAHEVNPPQMVKDLIGIGSESSILTEVLKLKRYELPLVLDDTGFNSYLRNRTNLLRLPNGILVRQDNGVMDPSCYYPVQNVWPDGYLECSSCGGDTFVGKIARGQEVQRAFGIPNKEVRLPDQEISELEQYVVHPTGKYFTSHHREFNTTLPTLYNRINELVNTIRSLKSKNPKIPEEADRLCLEIEQHEEERDRLRLEIGQEEEAMYANYFDRVSQPEESDYTTAGLILPPSVAATYRELSQGVTEVIREPQVQAAIWEVTNRKNVQQKVELTYEN